MLKFPNPNSITTSQGLRRRRRDSGHLLLAILLMVALLTIALTYEAPRLIQQMKRDREEEMIHRGTEYARAIKKFYKKFGNYPTSIEQLEDTNHIRFLRKRYKDPLTKDGKWTLLHYTDVASLLVNTGGLGTSAAALASQGLQTPGSPASSAFGSSSPTQPGGLGATSFGGGNTQSAGGTQGGHLLSFSSTKSVGRRPARHVRIESGIRSGNYVGTGHESGVQFVQRRGERLGRQHRHRIQLVDE